MPGELINAAIAGIGTYVPGQVLTNAELEKITGASDEWIKSRSGIRERRISSSEEASSDLALIAAKRALKDAGLAPEKVDLVIVATNTPDMLFPPTACLVQDRLGIKNAGAFDLAAGCTGFIYAVAIGSQFVSTGAFDTVLVIGVDTLSKFVNREDRNTCVLFGDGAGAVVLRPAPARSGILTFSLRADGAGSLHLYLPAGGSRQPATQETIARKLHTIHMNGREIFKFAIRAMVEVTEEVLATAGLKQSDIDFFIPHQANLRIIESAARRLSLSMDKVLINIDRYGNTSAASIPLALEEVVREKKVKHGDHIVMAGFGTGLTCGAILMKWHDCLHGELL